LFGEEENSQRQFIFGRERECAPERTGPYQTGKLTPSVVVQGGEEESPPKRKGGAPFQKNRPTQGGYRRHSEKGKEKDGDEGAVSLPLKGKNSARFSGRQS